MKNRKNTEEFQAITLTIDSDNNLSPTAVYSPSRHQIKCNRYLELINSHKNRFMVDGDYNVKQRAPKSSSIDLVQYNLLGYKLTGQQIHLEYQILLIYSLPNISLQIICA